MKIQLKQIVILDETLQENVPSLLKSVELRLAIYLDDDRIYILNWESNELFISRVFKYRNGLSH